MEAPGPITLIGSGETAHIGGQIFEMLARQLPAPLNAAVLETPAGFETNSSRVAGRVADFLHHRLQNYEIDTHLIAARKKGTPYSPDSSAIIDPLYDSHLIFFGPGSPTYTVRQLEDSLAWQVIQARQRMGAALVLASAATIAIGKQALPIYEIYKVGEDPVWKRGLDLLRAYHLEVVIVPHWNNHDGGADVDTSRCFIGQERFNLLKAQLADGITVVGIDEQTALTIDFSSAECSVRGTGQVHILRGDAQTDQDSGSAFPISNLGPYRPIENPQEGLPEDVWKAAQQRQAAHLKQAAQLEQEVQSAAKKVPSKVVRLVQQRQAARKMKNWALADQLRDQIQHEGWQVTDSPDGPRLSPL